MSVFKCQDITTQVAQGRLETGSWIERVKIRMHLAFCWFCRLYTRQLKVLGEAFRLQVQRHLDEHDMEGLKRRLKDSLGQAK